MSAPDARTEVSKSNDWRRWVVYQIYPRSFADANGDGIGDIAGVRAHLPYLAALGVDALWFNPWYPSPLADAGYDITDYRAIDPAFGTLWQPPSQESPAEPWTLQAIFPVFRSRAMTELVVGAAGAV